MAFLTDEVKYSNYISGFIAVCLFIVLPLFLLIHSCSSPPPSPRSPQEIANIQLNADSDAAKIRAKEYAEASLKAPSTAKWASYNEFETARARDKKGQVIKDVWDVALYVDAQNSYGAMIRTKFLVTVKKTNEDWKLVNISTF